MTSCSLQRDKFCELIMKTFQIEQQRTNTQEMCFVLFILPFYMKNLDPYEKQFLAKANNLTPTLYFSLLASVLLQYWEH